MHTHVHYEIFSETVIVILHSSNASDPQHITFSATFLYRESCTLYRHKQSELFWTIFQHVKVAGSLGLTYPQLFDSLGQHRERTRTRVFNCLRILLQEQFVST